MKTDYARRKLKSLLIDLDSYTNEEFEQQMLRIIAGATGQDVQDDYCIIKTERDALAAQVAQLETDNESLMSIIKSKAASHIKMNDTEIRAEAGRAGFIAGCELIIDFVSDGSNTGSYKFHADEYADKVRQGGE